jgi:hypothetical protein
MNSKISYKLGEYMCCRGKTREQIITMFPIGSSRMKVNATCPNPRDQNFS